MTIVAQMSDVDPWLLVFIWHAWDMIVITNLVYSNLKLRNQYDFYFNSVELVFFFNLEYKRWSKNISTDILILETQKIALLSFVILKWKSPCTKTFLMNRSARFKSRNISFSHTLLIHFSIMANNWCW